jgi:transposase
MSAAVRVFTAAFASYAGVAPVEMSSAERVRHRLPLGGDRQLNHALHIVAVNQIRMPGSAGRAYYDTKIGAGKTEKEARRCLKRRLADHIWRLMIRDERDGAAGPGGQQGATLQSSAAGSTPTTSTSDKSLPEPATPDSTTGQQQLEHRGTYIDDMRHYTMLDRASEITCPTLAIE